MKTLPWQRKPRASSIVGLSIGESALSIVLLRRDGETVRVERSTSLPLSEDRLTGDPEAVGRELAEAFRQTGIRERHCAVRLPPRWALTSSLALPEVSGEDLGNFLELRAEREFPIPPSELALAHSRYERAGEKPWATLAAIPSKRLRAVAAMLHAAGRKPVSISLGLAVCAARNGSPSPGAISFWPSDNRLDLVVSVGDGIVSLRSLEVGGAGAATEEGPIDAETLAREIRITLGRLPESLRAQVREARFLGSGPAARSMMGSTEPRLRDLGFDRVHLVEHRPGLAGATELPENCLPALEVATRYLEQAPATFEFLQPRVGRFQKALERYGTGKGRLAGAVGVGVVVVFILAAFIQSRLLASLESRWSEMAPRVAQLEELQLKLRQFRPWFDNSSRMLLIARRVTEAFPEEGSVWAKMLHVRADSTVQCVGSARGNQAFLEMMERLRKLPNVADLKVQQVRGESPIRFSIQFTWKDGPNT